MSIKPQFSEIPNAAGEKSDILKSDEDTFAMFDCCMNTSEK